MFKPMFKNVYKGFEFVAVNNGNTAVKLGHSSPFMFSGVKSKGKMCSTTHKIIYPLFNHDI